MFAAILAVPRPSRVPPQGAQGMRKAQGAKKTRVEIIIHRKASENYAERTMHVASSKQD